MRGGYEASRGIWRLWCFGRHPRRTLARVCVWTVLIHCSMSMVLLPVVISGTSMAPTYENGMRNMVNRLAYVRKNPQRGDVIVMVSGLEDELYIKRIVAEPGDLLRITGGRLELNGEILEDGHEHLKIPIELEAVRLKAGEYFVIGDNRECSYADFVERERILGRVVF